MRAVDWLHKPRSSNISTITKIQLGNDPPNSAEVINVGTIY
uniref:Uncharacterized protein n=2 Tax=Iconisemion striatum TaxID=60296 RepID=A0A1A7XED7_9TELE